MADAGLILACAGCCGGHPDKGGARIARPAWRRAFAAVLAYARDAVAAAGVVPPPALAERSFSWTGGGLGPEPV